jgi:hypothetical protein
MSRLSGCVVAMVVEDGVERALAGALAASLRASGAVVHAVSAGGRDVRTRDGTWLPVQADLRQVRPRYYDGLIMLEGAGALDDLRAREALAMGARAAGRPVAVWAAATASEEARRAFVEAFAREVEALRQLDEVEEASEESFPASDAPGRGSFT